MQTKKQVVSRIVRWVVLGLSTGFFLFFSTFVQEHAICPIGGFELFFTNFFKNGFTAAGLFSGMTLIFIIMSALSVIFRRAYCGYICPMGAIQELAERIGSLMLPKKLKNLRLPAMVDRILRWVKYAVLAGFVAGAAITGTHWMIPGDPFIAMMSLFVRGGLEAAWGRFPFAVLFFFAIPLYSLFLGKGFCTYICPAGAWYAILSKISPTRIVRDANLCIGCGKCTKACPMQIDVASEKSVKSAECIGCLECVNACPQKGALSFKAVAVTVPPVLLPIAGAAVFAGSVALAVTATPQRGERPQGGQDRGKPSEAGAAGSAILNGGTQSNASGGTGGAKVSLGGCPSCSGCGFCRV